MHTHSSVLDLSTLEAVKAEVTRRADSARDGWRLWKNPLAWERASELDAFGDWLDGLIAAAIDAMDIDLDERIDITPAGRAALEASRKIIRFPRRNGNGDAA